MRFVILAAAFLPAAAAAQQPAQERPQVLTRVLECRSIAAEQERLACFDREVAALEAAESSRELVVMDRQQVRRTRRTLFGLTLPSLGLFGDDSDDDGAAVNEINATIRSATQNGLGKWIITLEDGASWIQIDSRELGRDPRPGRPIRIRRAALGSYLANVDDQIAIRVRRLR